jgi:hypothetical protein
MVRHTSGKHLLMNAFLNDIPVKVVVDTAAMITLVNEKLICGEEHGDEGLVKLRGLGEQLVYGRIVKNVHIKIGSQTITCQLQLLLVYHSERHSSGDACRKCALPSLQFPLY